MAAVENLGKPAVVKKYSGGKLVYAGISSGKIDNEEHSDGIYFADKCDGNNLTEVEADIVVTRPEKFPTCEELLKLIKE